MFVPQISIFRRAYLSAGPWVIFKEFSHWNTPCNKAFLYVWSTKPACLHWFVQMMWVLVNICFFLGGWSFSNHSQSWTQHVPISSAPTANPRLRFKCREGGTPTLAVAARGWERCMRLCHKWGSREDSAWPAPVAPFPWLIPLRAFCGNKPQTSAYVLWVLLANHQMWGSCESHKTML